MAVDVACGGPAARCKGHPVALFRGIFHALLDVAQLLLNLAEVLLNVALGFQRLVTHKLAGGFTIDLVDSGGI